jgi:hypothetical protein
MKVGRSIENLLNWKMFNQTPKAKILVELAKILKILFILNNLWAHFFQVMHRKDLEQYIIKLWKKKI